MEERAEQRRPRTSRERLAEVGRHLLGTSLESTFTERSRILPVVALPNVPPFPVYALCQAFRARGYSCEAISPDDLSMPNGAQFTAGPISLTGIVDATFGASAPKICLLPMSALAMSAASSPEVLLPTLTHIDGVREAFGWIKTLFGCRAVGAFRILMVEAPSTNAAQQHFEKLDAGTRRFLGERMDLAGCLFARYAAAEPGGGSSSEQGAAVGMPLGLGGIADALLTRWAGHPRPHDGIDATERGDRVGG